MFSYQGSACPQWGHRERGRTMLSSLGTRAMTTLRKLPSTRPRITRLEANKTSIGESKVLNENTWYAETTSW